MRLLGFKWKSLRWGELQRVFAGENRGFTKVLIGGTEARL